MGPVVGAMTLDVAPPLVKTIIFLFLRHQPGFIPRMIGSQSVWPSGVSRLRTEALSKNSVIWLISGRTVVHPRHPLPLTTQLRDVMWLDDVRKIHWQFDPDDL